MPIESDAPATVEPQRLFDPGEVRVIPSLTTGERIDLLQQNQGFIPDSTDELSEALSAISLDNGPLGAAKHLGEIYGHQERAKAGSGYNAARAVTNRYIGYYRSGISQLTHLTELGEDLKDVNPNVDLKDELDTSRTSAAILANFIEKSMLLKLSRETSRTFAPVDLNRNLTQKRNDADVKAAISEALEGITVGEARKIIAEAAANHKARRDFWKARLEEVQLFTPVRHIAQLALKAA
jgi:hypothetical protein